VTLFRIITLDYKELELCAPPAWYLKVDLILFLIIPILGLIGSKSRLIALIVALFLFHFASENCVNWC